MPDQRRDSNWMTRRQRDGGLDRVPLPSVSPAAADSGPADSGAAMGELWLCGKHAIGPDVESLLAEVRGGSDRPVTVVCLVRPEELVGRFPSYVEWLRAQPPEAAVWRPIPDLSYPPAEVMRPFIDDLVQRLRSGRSLVVHCAAGIGRAGTTAVGILVALGMDLEVALTTVGAARPMAGPEAGSQRLFVQDLASIYAADTDS